MLVLSSKWAGPLGGRAAMVSSSCRSSSDEEGIGDEVDCGRGRLGAGGLCDSEFDAVVAAGGDIEQLFQFGGGHEADHDGADVGYGGGSVVAEVEVQRSAEPKPESLSAPAPGAWSFSSRSDEDGDDVESSGKGGAAAAASAASSGSSSAADDLWGDIDLIPSVSVGDPQVGRPARPETCGEKDGSSQLRSVRAESRSRSRSPKREVAPAARPFLVEEANAEIACALVRGGSMPSTACWALPELVVGTDHYVKPIWEVLGRYTRGLPKKTWLVESLCSGSGGESEAHCNMGIPTQCLGFADTKPLSRRWLIHHWQHHSGHVFRDCQAYIDGFGMCDSHGGNCKVSSSRPHVAIGGLPCPPWSRQRQKNGNTQKTQDASRHPASYTVFGMFEQYLTVRKPYTFWIEEVDTFATATKNSGGESPLTRLLAIAVRHGYSTRALFMCNGTFNSVVRRRCYVFGVSMECGHSRGANWVAERVQEVLRHRMMTPPTPLGQIVEMESLSEVARRHGGQAAVFCDSLFLCLSCSCC